MDGRLRLARAVVAAALILFIANYGYGLAHEAAHAAVIDAMGGQVYGIYVNALGTDAYTEHAVISDQAGLVIVNLAGIGVTTLLAAIAALAGQTLLATFLGARTSIYAINYGPGTDVSTIYGIAGNVSIALSLLVVAVNLACICYAVARKDARVAAAGKKLITGLSSS